MKNWYLILLLANVVAAVTAMQRPSENEKYRFETPFTIAIIKGDVPTVERMLIEDPSLANKPNNEQVPPLFVTTECECRDYQQHLKEIPKAERKECACLRITRKLLEAGADKDYFLASPEVECGTPLMAALQQSRYKIFKTILAFKPNLEIQKKDGSTILLIVAKEESNKLLKKVVNAGANLHHKDKEGNDALYQCVSTEEYVDTVDNIELLVNAGVNVNQLYAGGNNVLMHALMRQYSNYTVQKLVGLGVNVLHKNHAGQTALEIARASTHFMKDYIVPLLEKAEENAKAAQIKEKP